MSEGPALDLSQLVHDDGFESESSLFDGLLSHSAQREPPTQTGDSGIDFNGLAAVLQAVHAQAENSHVAYTRSPEYSSKTDAEHRNTRSAPAFHSLTASDSSNGGHSSSQANYIYPDADIGGVGIQLDKTADDIQRLSARLSAESPEADADHITSPFSDLDDIFASSFEQRNDDSTDTALENPPVIPKSTEPETRPARSSPQPVLAPSNRSPPVASTSAVTLPGPEPKKHKRPPDRDLNNTIHTCEYAGCSKTFTRRSDLSRHTRIHTGERPFLCVHPGCGKTFIQRSALHVHARVHTGEKPHSCEYPGCGRTFGDSSSLARHRRTHTGKRPYKCEDPRCEKTFTRRTTLNQHMRSHDPQWEPDPSIRYSFKKRRLDESIDDDEVSEQVRTISSLFELSNDGRSSTMTGASTVASLSAEIAAAIAQAHRTQSRVSHSRTYAGRGDDDDSGDDHYGLDSIVAKTSGIRDDNVGSQNREDEDDDEDESEFPIPLRRMKNRDSESSGAKRKRSR